MATRKIDLLVVHRSENGNTGAELALRERGAYHVYILKDGTVQWALSPSGFDLSFEIKGAHAVGYNSRSIAIAVLGCFDPAPDGPEMHPPPRNLHPTIEQLNALDLLIEGLCYWFGRRFYLAGHTELPGATAFPNKRCPGRNLDMAALRAKHRLVLPPC